ncbi:MAG: hypothetical protein K2J39_13175 [Ruminococcus sp.]|nr:hypothetical protein [Ruminococcus sp.]
MKIWLEISQNVGLGKSSLSLDTALREYGKMESADMLPYHLFLPLWCSEVVIDSELLSKNADNSVARYTISKGKIDDICKEIRTDDTNSMFMLYSYRFILSD